LVNRSDNVFQTINPFITGSAIDNFRRLFAAADNRAANHQEGEGDS
jgi:hypothetical protein